MSLILKSVTTRNSRKAKEVANKLQDDRLDYSEVKFYWAHKDNGNGMSKMFNGG